jgi:hypothetical protein
MNRMSVLAARREQAIGQQARIQGWIRTRRDSKGGFSFLEVNDGSCLANLQIIADAQLSNYESEIKHLTAGCSITADGEIKASAGKGQASELAGPMPNSIRCRRSGTRSRSFANGLTCGRERTPSALSLACATPSAVPSIVSFKSRASSTSTLRS